MTIQLPGMKMMGNNPTFTAADIATNIGVVRDIHIADIDHDGDLDIGVATSNNNSIAWYENDGKVNPTWSGTTIASNADKAYDIHIADIDNDGDLDIISASHDDDKVAWYESDVASNNELEYMRK